MKKILFIATIPGFITAFMDNNIKILHELNFEIHIATNLNIKSKRELPQNVVLHHIDIQRNPLKFKNVKTYKQLIEIIKENKINIIDCHTPVGGMLGRLVAHKNKVFCIYTAHGFHFFKGAPLKNWLIYYPIEKWLSKYTDVLITINKEDYNIAKEKFKMKQIEYVPGVGINTINFRLTNFNRKKYREKLGYSDNDFVILSVGELNKNKNHEVVLKAISELNNPNIKYMIAGQGNLKEYLIRLSKKLNIINQVQLLGFRNDIAELNNSADLFVFPSKREGLGLAAIEAMASGVPIITSNVHGMNDYSKYGISGYSFASDDVNGFANGINDLLNNEILRKKMGRINRINTSKYDLENVEKIMRNIYLKI